MGTGAAGGWYPGPGWFWQRGIEGKIKAIHYARQNLVPYLGLCLGMQLMVVEFARHLLSSDEPNSTEFDRSTHYPVIDLMPISALLRIWAARCV